MSIHTNAKTKVATPIVINKIEQYKREKPNIFSWQIKERLINEGKELIEINF